MPNENIESEKEISSVLEKGKYEYIHIYIYVCVYVYI
jgi:hypothetical protein